jgi:hypothetical protein
MVLTGLAMGRSRAEDKNTTFKTEHFDRDPGWDAYNNRLKPDPKEVSTVDQNFGYSNTQFAGGGKGELGGKIWRSVTSAFYADKIPVKTLNDKLTASGRFSITDTIQNAGLWFGWFKADRQELGTARPKSAFGMNFDFLADGSRLSVRMTNDKDRGCGSFVTPYLPGRFRHGSLGKNVQYSWTLNYDPQANSGHGWVEFRIKSIQSDPANDATMKQLAEEWKDYYERTPASRKKLDSGHYGRPDYDGALITFDLPEGFKETGASFDHFGLVNIAKEGRSAEIYFDDLAYDGQTQDFAKDPGWDERNNRAQMQAALHNGYHDFGFSADTQLAGGSPGEMGGYFWLLSKAYGYYADRIGPLTLDDPLEAHGKLFLKYITPDCEMCFGWFNSSQREPNEIRMRQGERGLRKDPRDTHLRKTDHFLGAYLTHDGQGCAFRPALVTAQGTKIIEHNDTPHLEPRRSCDWTVKYDPAAEGGKGAFSVTLGGKTKTLILDAKLRAEGATFDRFGFFPSGGGGMVHIYFDDLKYTAHRR